MPRHSSGGGSTSERAGHQGITVFVPMWRKEAPRPDTPITGERERGREREREREREGERDHRAASARMRAAFMFVTAAFERR